MNPALLAKRNIFITTSFPEAPLVFEAMSGQEMLGRPFNYQVDLLSDSQDVDLQAMLGHRMTVHVEVLAGRDPHHIAESEFKAFARAFRFAKAFDPAVQGVPSTKGTL